MGSGLILSIFDSVRNTFSNDSWSLVGVTFAAMSVGAATCAYLFHNKAKGSLQLQPVHDLAEQTVLQQEECGGRVSKSLKDGQLLRYLYEDAQTLYQIMRRGMRESVTGECLGYRRKMEDGTQPYVWLSYKEVLTRAENVAAGFLAKGLDVGQETFIGLYSQNRPEVVVPLYDTLGAEACTFIINKMEMQMVICDTCQKAQGLLNDAANCPSLRVLVVMENPSDEIKKKAEETKIEILTFDALEEIGKRLPPPPHQPPSPPDLATVCFTSGTTGTPKGVMLTHANIASDCTPFMLLKYTNFNPSDTMISFLPLAHMFERVLETTMYMHGCRVGFFRGNIKLLTEDIKELRPTFMPTVPRLLNRIYDKVMGEVNKSGVKKLLMGWAMSSKAKELKKSIIRNNSLWDSLVFKKVREGMGGQVKLVICGSAPLAESVLTFTRAALGCIVLEGYGQTECVAAATVTMEGDHVPGQVGPPIPCCAIKLVDVPDMGYFNRENKGEVCIKGHNVSPGYYKEEEKTKEAFDPDGWLHTGDIGMWTKDGTLKIIDRKKHIFKLSQGEYIAPEKIEMVYGKCKYLAQVFVYGESLKSCLIAIVVPDPEVMVHVAKKDFGMKDATMEELCASPEVKKKIYEDMMKIGKDCGLLSFEQVKDIYLESEMFTVENGLLTPTMKTKRPDVKILYKAQLEKMYEKLD